MPEPHRPAATYRRGGSAARQLTSSSLESISDISDHSISSPTQSVRAKQARGDQVEAAASAENDDASDVDGTDIEECIESMVAQRDRLRKRFKEWADDMNHCAKKMRCVTDNALVNQSTRLEQILSEGKARIDSIVNDQNRIRDQLCSFVSMLSNAQSQIFGETGPPHTPSSSTSHTFTNAIPSPRSVPGGPSTKR
ncbi:hypothetical protein GGH94_002140 [Coemansia aciculifera]|uniref:Uncharacterized protein n=1 Tax=Coemansia aciculifera TaxID=417176 RepID=A0A9W8IMI3_9FUNG|nr:hypothetical protein GGH94_002140 [Coemansia aciculifera]KAJ2875118.1 hypothetical protein GGH93_001876 [Coemansia aciculifera]